MWSDPFKLLGWRSDFWDRTRGGLRILGQQAFVSLCVFKFMIGIPSVLLRFDVQGRFFCKLVMLVTLNGARFNEWGQAVWAKQKGQLDGTALAPQWRYLAFIADSPEHDARDHTAPKIITTMQGKVMSASHQHNGCSCL